MRIDEDKTHVSYRVTLINLIQQMDQTKPVCMSIHEFIRMNQMIHILIHSQSSEDIGLVLFILLVTLQLFVKSHQIHLLHIERDMSLSVVNKPLTTILIGGCII